MVWPFCACSTSLAASFTVSPSTSFSTWITGPLWKPTCTPSLLSPTAGGALMEACIFAAASTAASGVGKSTITSSPIVFTTWPPVDSAAVRSRSMQRAMAFSATASPCVSISRLLPLTSAKRTVASLMFGLPVCKVSNSRPGGNDKVGEAPRDARRALSCRRPATARMRKNRGLSPFFHRHAKTKGCSGHRHHRAGRRLPRRAAARQGLHRPRHQAQGVALQHRPHRSPLPGSARRRSPLHPALRRHDRLLEPDAGDPAGAARRALQPGGAKPCPGFVRGARIHRGFGRGGNAAPARSAAHPRSGEKDPLLPGLHFRTLRPRAREPADGEDPLLPALAVRRREALRLLDHGELPRGVRHVRLQRHPLQP